MIFKPNFNQFFDFERMESTLKRWADEQPELCKLQKIGVSHRNRTIYALEISDFYKGNAEEKPGYYIESCIHAEEVMGTNVSMYIAWYLLSNFKNDSYITSLLESQVFYVLPRVNPDGAEFVLEQGQPWCGNGFYLPGEEQPEDGFYWKDIDKNGVVAQMRIPDKNGEWKVSDYDKRFMVQRESWELEGDFYRLLPEGEFHNFNGELHFPKPQDGNLNRQFPANFYPEGRQYGAWEVPLQEPESKAVGEFFLSRPNIGGVMSYHTNAGVILRPFGDKSDDNYRGQDLKLYKTLGQLGTDITGYPLISVFHEFTTSKDVIRGGTLTDWTYEFMGLPSFVTELWNVNQAAEIGQEGFYPKDLITGEDNAKVLKYLEQYMDNAYLDWEEYDHPQLGKVEIGGWNRIWVFRNAPEQILEKIAATHCEYSIKLAATLPKIEIQNIKYEKLDTDIYRLTAMVGNSGYLPTYLTDQARFMRSDEEVKVRIASEQNFEILDGRSEVNIGHLEGRSNRTSAWSQWIPEWKPAAKNASWIIKCKQGTNFSIETGNKKSGTFKESITLS